MQHGTVSHYNPRKRLGFIRPDTPAGEVFFHLNNGHPVKRPIHSYLQPMLVSNIPVVEPRVGDRVVFESELTQAMAQAGKKARAVLWAYETDWNSMFAPTSQTAQDLSTEEGLLSALEALSPLDDDGETLQEHLRDLDFLHVEGQTDH